jgi:AraC family transcriptional regulator
MNPQHFYTRTVVSQVSAPGTIIEMADCRWKQPGQLLHHEPCHVVRWIVRPRAIEARGWIRDGYEASFGQLTLFLGNTPVHFVPPLEGSARVLRCHFDPEWFQRSIDATCVRRISHLGMLLNIRSSEIEFVMRRLAAELAEPGSNSKRLLEALAMTVAVEVSRFLNLRMKYLSGGKGTLSPTLFQRIVNFISSFPMGSPEVADVAAECGLSDRHLRRLFKASVGQTLRSYIEDVRISRAKAMLADPQLSIKIISHRLGFCSPSAFSSTFRRVTGQMPREFRH